MSFEGILFFSLTFNIEKTFEFCLEGLYRKFLEELFCNLKKMLIFAGRTKYDSYAKDNVFICFVCCYGGGGADSEGFL